MMQNEREGGGQATLFADTESCARMSVGPLVLGKSYTHSVIEHGNVALYVPALQCCAALLAGQVCVLLNGFVMGTTGCAVRTIGLSVFLSCAAVYRRLHIGRARGTEILFDCLRPMIMIWTVALVAEQLLRSCGRGSVYSPARSALYHTCTVLLTVAGFGRARAPCSEHDWQFQLASVCILSMTALPPAYDEADQGPLCTRPDLFDSLERMSRTAAFAALYSTMAVVEAPTQHTLQNVTVTACRATAASAWVLCVNRFFLLLVLPQMLLAIHSGIEHHKATYAVLPIANDSDAGTDDDEGSVGRTTGCADRSECSPSAQHMEQGSIANSNVSAAHGTSSTKLRSTIQFSAPQAGRSISDRAQLRSAMMRFAAESENSTCGS